MKHRKIGSNVTIRRIDVGKRASRDDRDAIRLNRGPAVEDLESEEKDASA